MSIQKNSAVNTLKDLAVILGSLAIGNGLVKLVNEIPDNLTEKGGLEEICILQIVFYYELIESF